MADKIRNWRICRAIEDGAPNAGIWTYKQAHKCLRIEEDHVSGSIGGSPEALKYVLLYMPTHSIKIIQGIKPGETWAHRLTRRLRKSDVPK